jgi:hypothetical protein
VGRSKLLLGLILGFPALLFAAAALRAVDLAREGPVPAEYRDLNCDGKVSPIEWLRAGLDYDLKDVGEGCKAIYYVKTNHTVVFRCDTEPKCRTAQQWHPASAANR